MASIADSHSTTAPAPTTAGTLLAETVKHAYTIDYERIKTLAAEKPPCDEMRYRPCPVCGELMHRSAFGLRSGVIIDRCARHGVWLDRGELRRLMELAIRWQLERNAPIPRQIETRESGAVVAAPRVGGLHHRYSRVA